MFEDLIPSTQAETPAPPPGLFDDLIPTDGAEKPAAAGTGAHPNNATRPEETFRLDEMKDREEKSYDG